MKKNLSLLIIAILFTLQNCRQEESIDAKTQLNIEVLNADTHVNFDDITSVVVSVTTIFDDEVIYRKRVNLIKTDDGLKSENFDLVSGSYIISELFLIDEHSNIVFASPMKNSILSRKVKNVLGDKITIQANKLNSVRADVLAVQNSSPSSFGYKSFNVSAVQFIQVGVKASDNEAPFVKAVAYIIHDNDTLSVTRLSATANLIKFDADDGDACKLVIIKDGYSRSTTTFTPASIGHNLFVISLTPAFTFRMKTFEDSEIGTPIEGFESSTGLVVDWGDGIVEHFPFKYTYQTDVEYAFEAFPQHFYHEAGREYFVSITGDLDNIRDIEGNALNGEVTGYTFQRLNNLTDLNFFIGQPHGIVDLRNNTGLRRIIVGGDSVILPNTHNIKSFGAFGRSRPASEINYFIDNIYKNAVRKNITGGYFNFSADGEGQDTGEYIGEPTAESWSKLHKLQDQYQWQIVPAFD